ncbi:MAG: EamA family transporter [Gammaproteobacteria bacterium]|nr:EamA family transporter [Gammaproteobacteria bacterium]
MWFIYSLLSAVFLAGRDLAVKRQASRLDSLSLSFALSALALPVLALGIAVFGVPELKPGFWGALAAAALGDGLAALLYVRALKAADLSRAVPMLSFLPVFQVLSAPFLVGETPSAAGLACILVTVAGSYLLNFSDWRAGLWAPFKILFRERGSRLMLAVALLWSLTASFHKLGVQRSSPAFWLFAVNAAIALMTYPLARAFGASPLADLRAQGRALVLPAFANALTMGAFFAAVQTGQVAYASSIRRLSVVFSLAAGAVLLRERPSAARWWGVAVMTAGAALLALAD